MTVWMHTMIEEKLKEMQDNEGREERVEVNVKCIAPFHILVPAGWLH